MKNYLISIGGNSTSNVLSIERNFDEIIAVDSGVEHLFRLSLDPNTLIGDLDSISEKSLDKIKKNEVDNLLLKTNEKISRRPAARPGILATSSKDKFGIDLLRCLIYRIIKHW